MGDLCGVAADDARDLEVGSSAEGFDGVAADVAVADDGCSDLPSL